jgi:ribosome-binding factor A
MNETRIKRLEKQILRLAAEITYRRLKSPDVGFVTYTGCTLSNDGTIAEIKVSVYDYQTDNGKSIRALNRANGVFRSIIGKNLRLKNTPEIKFVPDDSLEKMDKIDALLKE